MFFNPRNDFYEMFCHHTMSIMTIAIAYITNYSNYAVAFMLVIDNADIFVGLIRIFMDIVKSKMLVLTIYLTLMVSTTLRGDLWQFIIFLFLNKIGSYYVI